MRIENLLEDLITPKITKKQTDTSRFKDARDRGVRDDYTDRGVKTAGYYGKVVSTGDPHTVNKRNFVASDKDNDGYLTYIRAIVDNKLYETNPYAPRVYDIKTIEDSRGMLKFDIKLETLHPLDNIEHDILWMLMDKIVDRSIAQTYDRYSSPRITIGVVLRELCKGKLKTTDRHLNEICELIRNVIKNNPNLELDMHGGNIMVRMSPYPQLVITDPISD